MPTAPRTPLPALTLLLCLSGAARAGVIQVPADQPTIQAAIDQAVPGDTVLVAPGTYYENVDFLGKDIVVASHYALTGDPRHIRFTVIDGSQPADPNVASCVRMVSGETRAAVLQGFTLTGGRGTRWFDIHVNQWYREGGGVLIELSSPTIRDNLIERNVAIDSTNVISAGGGGIRIGDGDPLIVGNVIRENRGRYGAGVVLNFATGELRNNLIVRNRGGEAYGGGGIWTYQAGASRIEHNTIVGNYSATRGGGLLVWSTTVVCRNNIVWGNLAPVAGPQIHVFPGAAADVSWCDVQGGWPGTGNLRLEPRLAGRSFVLDPASPCVDAGDPAPAAEDPEDPTAPGSAAYPARGGLRADMGAYGGPGCPSWYPRLLADA